jgi:hypothetical protein
MTRTSLYVVASILAAGCSGTVPIQGSSGSSVSDAGLNCCPANFDLYSCQHTNGTAGLSCHNPAMGCASSLVCGQGCDSEVSGRCECIQNVLCVMGSHFDRNLCKCVPDATNADAGATCVQNVLCIIGDHFDRNLCKCVPDTTNADAGATCVQNVLCVIGDHFDRSLCKCVPDTGVSSCVTAADCKGVLPALCEQCGDGSTACAHFVCASGTCQVAVCG